MNPSHFLALRRRVESISLDGYFRALSFYVTLLCSIQVLSIGVSLLEVRISRGLAIAILLASFLAATVVWRACMPTSLMENLAPERWTWGTKLTTAVTVFAVLVYLVLWFAAYVSPDRSWDGNTYHLPSIHFWARRGYIHWIDPRFPFSNHLNGFPKGLETLSYLVVTALGDSQWVNAVNLVVLPLGVLGIACLARSLGTSSGIALFAGGAFLLVPVNVYQSVTTYTDTGYASAAAAFLAALGVAQSRIRASHTTPWCTVPALGGAAGLALSAKPTAAAVVVPGLLALGGATLLFRRGGYRSSSRFPLRALLFLLLAGAWCLAVGGYWYGRNYVHEGSPLYPVRVAVAGRTVFPGETVARLTYEKANRPEFMKTWSRGHRVLYSWAQGWRNWPGTIRGVDNRSGGLGYLWPLGCLSSLGYAAYQMTRSREARDRMRPLFPLGTVTVIAFLMTPMDGWVRFTIWIYALGLPCFAVSVHDLVVSRKRLSWAKVWFHACLVALVFEGAFSAVNVLGQSYPGPRPVHVTELLRPRNWRWPANYLFPETRGSVLDDILGSREAVAFGPAISDGSCGPVRLRMIGQLAYPIGSREIVPLSPSVSDESLREIRARGVRTIVWGGDPPPAGRCPPPLALERLARETHRVSGFWIATLRR